MNGLLKQIIAGDDIEIEPLLRDLVDSVFKDGTIDISVMERLSLIKMYHADLFAKYEQTLLSYMGTFYKNPEPEGLKQAIFKSLGLMISDKYHNSYTPVQVSIVEGIKGHQCFSFSAPTSTGKSYVFLNLIKESTKDIVIVVPSRALINEYMEKVSSGIPDKDVNILPFIDRINIDKAKRSIFIVTPERCRVLFAMKDSFDVEYFLFDEAQLGDEESRRGVYYDSIIRRCKKAYPNSKFVFAHPFIANPECQIKKNHFDEQLSLSIPFKYCNVGQIYMVHDAVDNNYYHFGLNMKQMGTKVKCEKDPIREILKKNGSILVYSSKSKILDNGIFDVFEPYINLCKPIEDARLSAIIDKLKDFLGCSMDYNSNYYSQTVAFLKRGIIIHHGSMPLYARMLVEEIVKLGLCRICFATSTLEQGINMPFDLVYIDRLTSSKELGVKNLIGRAGRSTSNPFFDYGIIVLGHQSQMNHFRQLMLHVNTIREESLIDVVSEGDDMSDFKKSIKEETFHDEFNMTPNELIALEDIETVGNMVSELLDAMIFEDKLVTEYERSVRDEIVSLFIGIYSKYLGRDLCDKEKEVVDSGIRLMLFRIKYTSFKAICRARYLIATRKKSIKDYRKLNRSIKAHNLIRYCDIPNQNLKWNLLFKPGTRVDEVSYDTIVCDTYDYIDKLINFRLVDVFYAATAKYYEHTQDNRAIILGKFIKYGTTDEKKIWMLRYGITFEEIDKLESYITHIDEHKISVKQEFYNLSEDLRKVIERFV